jgi:predicted lipoprotein with Yx(FWY)xxD motif
MRHPLNKHTHLRRTALFGAVAAGSAGLLAACGSSTSGTASAGAGGGSTTSSSSAAPASGQAGGVTIDSAAVPGFGTVLVDSSGRTLYMLTSEQGGKITCTDDNGCTKVWPDTELPKGVTAATAGSGLQASLLSAVKDASGSLYVTYGGWPLYTFAGDSGPGMAKGEGISSFGGTWYVLGTNGQPVKAATSQSSSTTSGGSGGY